MQTYIALLRGINLGPNRRMAMADLRGWLADLGWTGVRTHLQSGNLIFSCGESATEATRMLEKRIAECAGFAVDCVLRTPAQLGKVVQAHPFGDIATDNAKLAVAFLSAPLPAGRLGDADEAAVAPERFAVVPGRREIFLWYANGMARAKLTGLLTDRKLGVSPTVRNWNTVTKLLDMARS